MEHPDLLLLIQRSQQVDSSTRQKLSMQRHLAPSRPNELRTAIGRALIALGTRIAPEPRPAQRRAPLGSLPIAGRADI